jgi:hypothetical protein
VRRPGIEISVETLRLVGDVRHPIFAVSRYFEIVTTTPLSTSGSGVPNSHFCELVKSMNTHSNSDRSIRVLPKSRKTRGSFDSNTIAAYYGEFVWRFT